MSNALCTSVILKWDAENPRVTPNTPTVLRASDSEALPFE